MRWFAVGVLAVVPIGCAGAAPERGPSEIDVEAWAGAPELPATPRGAASRPRGSESAPIQLAGGERFRSLLARSTTELPQSEGVARTCAVYSLRVGEHGLEEGQLAVDCEAPVVEDTARAQIAHAPLEPPRSAHVRAALEGATAAPVVEAAPEGEVHVWVETDRRALEASIAQVRWPAPYEDGNETPRGRPPTDIAELYEAVMYPGRYVARP